VRSRRQFETFLEERLHLSLHDTGAGQSVVSFWELEKVVASHD
jgi:hypothetical protein